MSALGWRMSKLPITYYCGLAGSLSDETGSIRAGVTSKWFHARCGEQWEEAQKLWLQMSDEEREDVQSWHKPATFTIDSNLIEYSTMEREIELAIDRYGNYVEPPYEGKGVMSIGHIDMGKAISKRAYVGDIKRSRFTVKSMTDSLQLHCYGFAYASKHKCHSYRVGIWQAIEGVWVWDNSAVDLESSRAADIWSKVKAAATNTEPLANKGSHCQDCWGRLKCPAYTLPAALGTTELAPIAQGGKLTPDNALKVLQLAEAMADISGAAIAACKAYIKQGGMVVDPVSGLEYRPVPTTGRESVKVSDVRAKFGAAAESIIKRGRDSERWDWVKRK